MNNFNEGEIFHGRYNLIKYLGGGELSEVWQVHDQLADIDVALKIYARVGEVGTKQFIKDFTLTESLHHPYILKPHHVDVFDRRPYLILRYCSKGSVSNRIEETSPEYKPFEERDIAVFMSQIGGALNYLHQNQILHRDVKPDNILIGDNGEFLLTDFGISKKVRSTLIKATSSTQVVSFSKPYAPPEILTGSEDPRKDIFSLGVTMYELLTEDLPFEGNGGTVLLMGVNVPELPDKFSRELNTILKTCMNKEVDKRLSAQDLENYGNTYLKSGKWPSISTKQTKPVKLENILLNEKVSKILIPLKSVALNTVSNIKPSVANSINYIKKTVVSLTNNLKSTNFSNIEIQKFKLPIIVGSGILATTILAFLFLGKKTTEEVAANPVITETLKSKSIIPEAKTNEEKTTIVLSKYDSLMMKAKANFKLKDYKVTLKESEEAWLINKNPEARQLYEKAERALSAPSMLPDNKEYLQRGNREMQNGSFKLALNYFRMACGDRPNGNCKIKINDCISKMSTRCFELIQQGKDAADNNKNKASDYFRQAKDLSNSGGFRVSQYLDLYQFYISRGDRLYGNDEIQDAKQWYQLAQVLNNVPEVQEKIQSCNK